MSQQTLIAIPAYNESQHIAGLVADIQNITPDIPILVVDDGSTDTTRSVLDNLNVATVYHQQNKGKGEALLTAARFAQIQGYQWMITLDGDGQHPPAHLPAFLTAIQHNQADLILGNRQQRTGSMPWHRRFSNGTTSVMVSLCCGQRVCDSQCGYRAIRVNALHPRDYRETGFMFESEMILRIGKRGYKIAQVPVTTLYNGQASSIHLVADTLRFIKLIIMSFTW